MVSLLRLWVVRGIPVYDRCRNLVESVRIVIELGSHASKNLKNCPSP
jgi:hypothetical protein